MIKELVDLSVAVLRVGLSTESSNLLVLMLRDGIAIASAVEGSSEG